MIVDRLTKKDNRTKSGCKLPTYATKNEEDVFIKLFKLENLAEELNFDLEIVIKALLNGIYCTHSIGERNYFSGTELSISGNHEALVVYENNVYWITKNGERIKQQRFVYKRFEFKDYGKTWWLKEDIKDE